MPIPTKTTIRFLALGDSYTIGQSIEESQRWPVQLSELVEASPGFAERYQGIDGSIIARTGWTTNELWRAIQQDPPEGTYEVVSLLVGVNDQYRGSRAEQYRQDFSFLLGKAIGYAGGDPSRVIVLSIPDWGVTPFASYDKRPASQIAAELNAFNAINKDEAQKAGVRYVDVTPVSRQATADPALIAGDGLHPSGKMYAAWAALALPEALAALGIEAP